MLGFVLFVGCGVFTIGVVFLKREGVPLRAGVTGLEGATTTGVCGRGDADVGFTTVLLVLV